MKRWPIILLFSFLLIGGPVRQASANPTQYGDTGLLSQPSAETLNAGNICIGLWANCAASKGGGGEATILPATITLGLGTFMEAYGSFPNLLFNDDELESGRGYANLGFKLRVLGKRSSPFKLAVDGQMRRLVTDDPEYDGLTDVLGRLIASYKPGKFGIHLNAGYLTTESPPDIDYDDQYIFGAGLEFLPAYRLRLIAELEAQTEKFKGADAPLEATLGMQYFLMPHLTLNFGVGLGMSNASPDWRALVGLSGCQGVGNFITPIERVTEDAPENGGDKAEEQEKKIRLKTLTPLLSLGEQDTSPVARWELPVPADEPEIIVGPEENLKVETQPVLEGLAVASFDAGQVAPSASESVVPTRAAVYRQFRLPDTIFAADQRSLSDEGRENLALLAEALRADRQWLLVRIDAHTDNVGPDQYNEELSRQRAATVASYLVLRQGIEPKRVFVKGFGESLPIADNALPEGRTENRRIEVRVLTPREIVE
ncbi:OmpA family protein [Desulfuromonas acetexigens]|uniref:OmpA family protein n=1 Tax=Trichloromonas acetexigens TaxID=38815 RepID=A0A550JKZ4_9BACT|nr:OmpA family protein [Desulfuromonas acetexigens]TRO83896.1 OmpA family protein [Desulfuromonas acetexigens]